MELNESQIEKMEPKKEFLVEELLNQNSELRTEQASLKAVLKEVSEELNLLIQMKQSQNIPPEALEMLSKLDIR